jgi:hypothetical protein
MAGAARDLEQGAYDAARKLALSGESQLESAIGSLASLGYEVRS